MTDTESLLCQILRDFAAERNTDFPISTDWGALVTLSVAHTVAGIVAYQAVKNPVNIPADTLKYLRGVCHNTVAEYTRRGDSMRALSEKLSAAGIAHMPFKGYVIRAAYPVPELRTFGDVDFLIRPGEREAVNTFMLYNGFQTKANWEPVFSYTRDKEYYEVHSALLDANPSKKADLVEYFSDAWDHAVKARGSLYLPEPGFHFLFLLAHLAKHITGGGAGLRMYLDLALLIKNQGKAVNWVWVNQQLEQLELQTFANTILTLVRNLFGIESPIPLELMDGDIYRVFLEGTLAGGIFGQLMSDPGVNSLKRLARQEEKEKPSKLKTLLHRAFPPAKEISARYTYLQDRPWLLPAAWVHRAFITRSSFGRHLNEAKSIINAEEEKVTYLTELYRAVGL